MQITELRIRKVEDEGKLRAYVTVTFDNCFVVHNVKIIEGKRERIQAFEGLVIAIKGSGVAKNFIVRKISSGVGVERTFPINSPKVAGITVIRKGKVRRAKLNYLRTQKKQAKIKERN